MLFVVTEAMWMEAVILITVIANTQPRIVRFKEFSMFKDDKIIFSSSFNITKLLVTRANSDIPSIYFTVEDKKFKKGSSIFVLHGFMLFQVLDGGRDATSSFVSNVVYFGAYDGIYKYDHNILASKKVSTFDDDVIQIQISKSNDLYMLTSEKFIYKVQNDLSTKNKIYAIECALEFVIDSNSNIYYIDCNLGIPHVYRFDGVIVQIKPSILNIHIDFKLLRPPSFITENCVPLIADGFLYILHSTGRLEYKDLFIEEKASAFSIDAITYVAVALDGKIYEFDIMDTLMKSMFRPQRKLPKDLTAIIIDMIESDKIENVDLKNYSYK